MNTYIIFQVNLRDLTVSINKLGWTKAAERYSKVGTHLECSFTGSKNFRTHMFDDYDMVAEIDALSLEDAFAISNLGNKEDQVTRFRPMHSMSVGDIVLTNTGQFYMVNGCGFGEIELTS